MRKVTEVEFFAYVNPRDVHPTPERMRSVWKNQRTGEIIGHSTPGYSCEGKQGYWLTETALSALKGE